MPACAEDAGSVEVVGLCNIISCAAGLVVNETGVAVRALCDCDMRWGCERGLRSRSCRVGVGIHLQYRAPSAPIRIIEYGNPSALCADETPFVSEHYLVQVHRRCREKLRCIMAVAQGLAVTIKRSGDEPVRVDDRRENSFGWVRLRTPCIVASPCLASPKCRREVRFNGYLNCFDHIFEIDVIHSCVGIVRIVEYSTVAMVLEILLKQNGCAVC